MPTLLIRNARLLVTMDAQRREIAGGGVFIRDHVVEAVAFPRPGETVTGLAVRTSVGGKGGNQAVAAARVGGDVAIVAQVGADDAGAAARAALSGAGVDTGLLRTVPGVPTGTALITVAEQDNTIVVVAGANGPWLTTWPDVPSRSALEAADVVLSQLEVPLEVVRAAAAVARGCFVLNAAPAAPLPDDLLARCSVLIVNEHEQLVVAGEVEPAAAHDVLRARGAGAVLTTLGPRGAVGTDADGTWTAPAPPFDVVDTTGAGDAFAGVLCARLAAGDDLRTATTWAVAAGSLAVRRRGTHDSYPDVAAVTALLG